jgi:hypothetical protein
MNERMNFADFRKYYELFDDLDPLVAKAMDALYDPQAVIITEEQKPEVVSLNNKMAWIANA